MTELLSLVNDLSKPLKVAWTVWLLWAGAQIIWYRRTRRTRAVDRPPLRRPAPRPRREAGLASEAGGPAPPLEMEERGPTVAPASVYR